MNKIRESEKMIYIRKITENINEVTIYSKKYYELKLEFLSEMGLIHGIFLKSNGKLIENL
jgi:hypothetical protein